MKKLLFLILFSIQFIQGQRGLRFNKTESFTISTSIDPNSSFKEKGIDFVGEIEYSGFVYVKGGFESFSALQGGYKDLHWAIGLNLTCGLLERSRFYAGIRAARVWRGDNGAYRINYGIESGFDYGISDNIFLGLRATIDKRYDQEIFRWRPESKFSGFIRIGYKWYYKKH